MNAYLAIAIGLVLLTIGGEALVRGAVGAGRTLGVSPLLVGLVLVGFGTSAPELTASVAAALRDSPGIAIGNAVGSNITNLLLILGVGAVLTPLSTHREAFTRDASALAAATVALVAVCVWGFVDRTTAVVFLLLLAGYIAYAYRTEQRRHDAGASLHEAEAEQFHVRPGVARNLFLVAVGMVALVAGARILVDGAIDLARLAGLSEAAIGLTVVAVGTSLPELAATVVAALRRQADVAVGNLIGSNLFNSLGIVGAAALARPLEIPAVIGNQDVWLMLVATACALLFVRTGMRIERWEGAVLLVAWVSWTTWRLTAGQ